MASADLLKSLFSSFKKGDEEQFYVAANLLINEEKEKKHNVLARDLQRILDNGRSKPISTPSILDFEKLPRDRERNAALLEIRESKRILGDVILSEKLSQQFTLLFKEYQMRERLHSYGLQPKRKLLFAGPPGCGKTISAEMIAGELGLPLLYIRFDAVISSYLGETANNLRKIFDFASKGSWIVFFDEFDAIGKSREDASEHGELKRVVNTFLQLLDGFNSESIFVAATNHEGLLDRALWRRFDDIYFFSPPTEKQISEVIKLKLGNVPHSIHYDNYISKMHGWSHADIERVCVDAIKISIIDGEEDITDKIFLQSL
ncbi:MAG: ATP-binding protein, partial [Anaerolineae bacterium]|nr:ATP-binding protein [Anaerolineae bacterium]